jgi:hypothetical protein
MIMIEIPQAAAGVTIAAEAEDEEMTTANAVLLAVDAAHLLHQDPTVVVVNGSVMILRSPKGTLKV